MGSTVARRPGEIEVHPVTVDRWDELVEFFERKGPRGGTAVPGACWCMAWREEQGSRSLRKVALKAAVDQGLPIGCSRTTTDARSATRVRRHRAGRLSQGRGGSP